MTAQHGTAPRSPLLRRQSDDLRFDWIGYDVAELKAGAKAVGGTLNDGFMAAVSLGLQGYHRDPRRSGRSSARWRWPSTGARPTRATRATA